MVPTSDHGSILQWATRHNAVPAEVRRQIFDSQPSVLRFLFDEARNGTPELKPISWDDFFARFDLLGLSIVLDDAPGFEFLEPEPPPIIRERNSN